MRSRILSAAIALALLGAAVEATPVLYVNLRVRAEASPGSALLRDLAVVTSPDAQQARRAGAVSIAPTPFPGQSVQVDRQTIAERLAARGIDSSRLRWGGAPVVRLAVKTVRVTSVQLLNAARAYLARSSSSKVPGKRWEPVRAPRDRLLAAGKAAPKLSVIPTSVRTDAAVVRTFVRIAINGKNLATVPVAFKAVRTRSHVAAARYIPRGRLLRASDVRLIEESASTAVYARRACSRLDQAIGKVAGRAIRAGQPVSLRLLAKPVIVRRGETVTVKLVRGSLEIVSRGEALADGRADDVIRVRIAATAKVLNAKVSGAGVVDVRL